MINIKDYAYYSKCNLKSFFIDLVKNCLTSQKNNVKKIRNTLKIFKFSFIPIYTELLKEIIK